jgi:hypothetical protein
MLVITSRSPCTFTPPPAPYERAPQPSNPTTLSASTPSHSRCLCAAWPEKEFQLTLQFDSIRWPASIRGCHCVLTVVRLRVGCCRHCADEGLLCKIQKVVQSRKMPTTSMKVMAVLLLVAAASTPTFGIRYAPTTPHRTPTPHFREPCELLVAFLCSKDFAPYLILA